MKILDTEGQSFNSDSAKEFISNYVKDNYKKVLKDVTQSTKVVDGDEMSVFTAQVQDANGVVQTLKFSWSEVTE
jgi:hypothetical protein